MSVAIMGILIMVFTTLVTTQAREMRGLGEKLGALDLERVLIASLANGSVCTFVTTNPTVMTFNSAALPQTLNLQAPNATSPPTLYGAIAPPLTLGGPLLPLNPIAKVGELASVNSKTLTISSIKLQITSGSNGNYLANWLVSFDASKLVRQLRPLSIATTINADDTAPAAAKIVACQGSGAGLGPYKEATLDFPGLSASSPGSYFLNSANFPTAQGTSGPVELSSTYSFFPRGTRSEITVNPALEIESSGGSNGLAMVVALKVATPDGVIQWVPINTLYADSVAGTGAIRFGSTNSYRLSLRTAPGIRYDLTLALKVTCGPIATCSLGTGTRMSVWSPMPFAIQEYY
jgi:hypothetical protein